MGQVLLEPGDEFPVSYGRSGKQLKAICLGSRSRKNVFRLMQEVDELSKAGKLVESVEKVEDAMRICFPGVTDDELDGMTHPQMANAIGDALGATVLDEDQQKK
jgi:hypothetical protein